MSKLRCFKAYDVRGRVPEELNEAIAYRIGRAYVAVVKPREVVLGRDVRPSSAPLMDALAAGLLDAGVDVLDLGQCGTEEVYFATAYVEGGAEGDVGAGGGVSAGEGAGSGGDVGAGDDAGVSAGEGAGSGGDVGAGDDAGVSAGEGAVSGGSAGVSGDAGVSVGGGAGSGRRGGIMVTASHNPKDYNGMKFVRAGAAPVSADSGLLDIQALAERDDFPPATATAPGSTGSATDPAVRRGRRRPLDIADAYISRLLSFVDVAALAPLKLVVNPGNGGAGAVVDRLEAHLPFTFVKLHHAPDGTFPNGVPNPQLVENHAATAEAVRASGADMGIAWDGDFDRCYFFDEAGAFVEGYYLVGLLAAAFLQRERGAAPGQPAPGQSASASSQSGAEPGQPAPDKSAPTRIVHDPRLTWNTREVVLDLGGEPVLSKAGHAFMKERMRAVGAAYGGEMSAHHYFRDFAYCDSGMVPWLLVAELVSRRGQPLSQLVAERAAAYPCSGEINRPVADPAAVLARVEARYANRAVAVDHLDGLSIEHADWRFNLRASNTEPMLRLNVESRAAPDLMRQRRDELLALIDST